MKLFEFLSEATSSSNIYTVRSGDSLPSLAKSHDTTVDGIMWQNPQLTNANDIQTGSRIRLPGAVKTTTASPGAMKTANPMAPGLTKEQIALLNMIAAKESSGDYNAINYVARRKMKNGTMQITGEPGHHPFEGQRGDTAAGRYQMLWTTWEQAAKSAGIDPTDFSPANQDRAALALAQQSYKKKFGSDLNTALTDPSKYSQVVAGLTPWSVQAGGPGFIPQNYAAALSAAQTA
jgi:spore germination protein YaaH